MSSTLDLVLRQSGGAMRFPARTGAAILGWSPATIRNLIWQGKLPLPYHKTNSRIFFLAQDVADYLDKTAKEGAS